MILIIEGVDCSGKDYVSERLLKRLKNEVYYVKHGLKPKKGDSDELEKLANTYETMISFYTKVLQDTGQHILFNRFFPSEVAYSRVMRGYETFTEDKKQHTYSYLEHYIIENNIPHLLIYINAENEDIFKRMDNRGEDYISKENVRPLKRRYDEFLSITKLEWIETSSSEKDIELLINIINEKAK